MRRTGAVRRTGGRAAGMLLHVLLCLAFLSCERRELTYSEVAEVSIRVDWSKSGLDGEESKYGATAIFYPQDGGEPAVFLMGDRSAETVRLREGVYDVILFNRSFDDFSGIAFRGTDRYESLEAYVPPEETAGRDSRTTVRSPERLAVATAEGWEVTEGMLGRSVSSLSLMPEKLTREVVVVLHVSGLHNVRSAKCRVDGVSESVFLSNGKLSGRNVAREFVPADSEFVPGSPFDGSITGTFEVFGFDFGITHNLHLEALLVDGKTVFTGDYNDVEVTEEEDGYGVITLHMEVATEPVPDVEPEGGSGSGFEVDVDGWGEDVNTDVTV